MKEAYSVGDPQETHGLRDAHETRDIHLRTINIKLKASIYRSYPADPPI
jgi:hypothetical protein